jgi:hypothetical protein
MKKLLAVATIGAVGYLVVKKIKERKNKEVMREANDIIEEANELVNEEVVGKAVNNNIEGMAEVILGIGVVSFVTICCLLKYIILLILGYKFYNLILAEGIIDGCIIAIEKVAPFVLAKLGIEILNKIF